MNIDASEQCYELATTYIRSGNLEKAEKLLEKSLKLHPNEKAKILQQKLKAGDFNKASGAAPSDGIHQRKRPAAAPKPEEPKLGEDYTKEQLEMVTKLKK